MQNTAVKLESITPIHTHADGSVHTHEHEHSHAHTHTNTKAVLNRLAKINGHVSSVRRMVEDGRDCSEVLVQLAAIRSAVNGVCKVILQDHIDHCLVDAIETGDTEAVSALSQAISILMK